MVTAKVLRALLCGVSVKIATAVGLNDRDRRFTGPTGMPVHPEDELPVRLPDGVGLAVPVIMLRPAIRAVNGVRGCLMHVRGRSGLDDPAVVDDDDRVRRAGARRGGRG